jgi:glycosyltransferase involved in cell wall biosynthesis
MLAQAILKLYDETVLREELGRNGRKYAEEHFSRNVCIKIYEKLFEKVCTQNAAMSIESEGI